MRAVSLKSLPARIDARRITASIAGVAPEISTTQTIKTGTESESVTVVGTTNAYASVRAYDVWQGTFLTNVSVDQKLRVVALGATTATNLGLGAADIGSEVTIGHRCVLHGARIEDRCLIGMGAVLLGGSPGA